MTVTVTVSDFMGKSYCTRTYYCVLGRHVDSNVATTNVPEEATWNADVWMHASAGRGCSLANHADTMCPEVLSGSRVHQPITR